MMNKDALYRELVDGDWRSGEQLASQFGVSRTVIWKCVAQLREAGVEVEANRGKGYRLRQPGSVLFERHQLESALSTGAKSAFAEIQLRDVTASTNEDCLLWLASQPVDEACKGILVVAEQQTQGRGRRGKQWVSPYAASLYMSLSQRFEMGAAEMSGLSLLVGIIVAQAIEQFTDSDDVKLKWPNDIYVEGKKLGGILLEVVGDVTGPCHAVIGIGINIGMPAEEASSIGQPFTTLAGVYPDVHWDKNKLAATIVNRLHAEFDAFCGKGFEPFIADWDARDFMRGQRVMVSTAAGKGEFGIHRGVKHDGALLIETASGIKAFSGGEVSLRPANV